VRKPNGWKVSLPIGVDRFTDGRWRQKSSNSNVYRMNTHGFFSLLPQVADVKTTPWEHFQACHQIKAQLIVHIR
jgi:hypothetical protein